MQMPRYSIAILGAGSWGTALSLVLAKSGLEIRLWDRDPSLLSEMKETHCNTRYLPEVQIPKNVVICHTLEKLMENVRDVLIAVPSHAFSGALRSLKKLLTIEHRLIWATKGLEPDTGNFLHQVIERELGAHQAYAVLSGPSFAKEVALGLPTAVMIASKDLLFAKDLVKIFSQDTFKAESTDDVIGVQLGGVVKNVLAVAVGLSDGVKFGANARAALMTMGLSEMMHLGEVLGARTETLMGLAGCGDVILTCTDNQSRNRRFGLALAEGLTETQALQEIGQVVEAVYNVKQLCHLAKLYQVKLPIAEQVFRVINQEISAEVAIRALFHQVSESV